MALCCTGKAYFFDSCRPNCLATHLPDFLDDFRFCDHTQSHDWSSCTLALWYWRQLSWPRGRRLQHSSTGPWHCNTTQGRLDAARWSRGSYQSLWCKGPHQTEAEHLSPKSTIYTAHITSDWPMACVFTGDFYHAIVVGQSILAVVGLAVSPSKQQH